MRRSDDTTPFDHEHQTQADLTQEFWGADRRDSRWAAHDERPSRQVARVDDTGSMRALRDGVAAFRPRRVELRDPTGQVRRTRSHGAPRDVAPSLSDRRATATIGDLAAGHFDDSLDREHDLPLTPVTPATPGLGLRGVDPLLVRLGAMVLVGVLLVPVALALRPSSADRPDTFQLDTPTAEVGIAAGAAPGVENAPLAADPSGAVAADENATATAATQVTSTGSESAAIVASSAVSVGNSSNESSAQTSAAQTSAAQTSAAQTSAAQTSTTETSSSEDVGNVTESAVGGIADAAVVEVEAERIIPECPQTYTAAPGDSWYGIAEAAGVAPNALMTENRATVETVILTGDDICLPSGATMPTSPTTTPTDTTSPAATTPATTEAPATTVAPTTPSGSPGTNASVAEVKDVIRSIFPESEWDTAFTIADRESRFVPTAYNGWCCYGVFQIYWNVHQSWLDDLGIDSSSDLYDPLLNVRAAHAIWQRSGNSWSAWSTYDG